MAFDATQRSHHGGRQKPAPSSLTIENTEIESDKHATEGVK